MICSCILAMLLVAAPDSHAALQQESDNKSAPASQPPSSAEKPSKSDSSKAAPPAQDKQSPKNPEPEKSKDTPQSTQGTSTEQAQPSPQSGQPEKPNSTPENKPPAEEKEKKPAPCVGKDSVEGNCAKRPAWRPHRVVHQGGTGEPTAQLIPGMTPEQAARHRQTTEEYLNAAGDDLRKLAVRNLHPNQQETVSQIRIYMVDARSALEAADLSRARTLAFKAYLLADDLVKH